MKLKDTEKYFIRKIESYGLELFGLYFFADGLLDKESVMIISGLSAYTLGRYFGWFTERTDLAKEFRDIDKTINGITKKVEDHIESIEKNF